MNATFTQGAEEREPYDARPDGAQSTCRPRRQFFNKRSAALVAVITCAAGFYAGVRVEKGQVTDSGSGGSSLAAAIAAARGQTTSPTTGGAGARSGSAASGAAGGLGALFARSGLPGGSAGGASFGTISSVNGKSLFVTTATGNVVKVKLTSATKISKSLNANRSALHPGDTVVIRGLTNSNATMTASSVSDSGASARGGFGGPAGGGGAGAAGGASGAGVGSSGSSASPAVSSLFSSGGSGG